MAIAEKPRTEVRAVAKFVHTAPRKAMLVADQIRGRSVPEARTILAFLTRDAARDVARVLNSAVANAEANHGLSGDDLFVATATVGAGPTLKRWRARARGRVGRIKKRTCHIEITLGLPGGEAIPAPLPPAALAEEKPKRAPRKKAEAVEAPAAGAAVVEAPPAEGEASAEEKPKRTPRKKAEHASEAEAVEEKPKRTRRKPESAAEPSGEAEKPARRKKKESEES
jgi:large subunit ribosomal protein L22